MTSADQSSATGSLGSKPVSGHQAIILSGFALLGVGILLPWVGETQHSVYVLGMESGFERQWGKRLSLGTALGVSLVLFGMSRPGLWPIIRPILSAIGAIAIGIIVFTTPLTGRWPPAIGLYVALIGALLVTGASVMPLLATRFHRP